MKFFLNLYLDLYLDIPDLFFDTYIYNYFSKYPLFFCENRENRERRNQLKRGRDKKIIENERLNNDNNVSEEDEEEEEEEEVGSVRQQERKLASGGGRRIRGYAHKMVLPRAQSSFREFMALDQ